VRGGRGSSGPAGRASSRRVAYTPTSWPDGKAFVLLTGSDAGESSHAERVRTKRLTGPDIFSTERITVVAQ
jgi:hypothetical protein